MTVELLFEDEHILIVNKPNNVLIYPSYYARNIKDPTLVEILTKQLGRKVTPLHRLDRKTSGIIICGKTTASAKAFEKLFSSQSIDKKYIAVVRGYCNNVGTINTPVKNNETGIYKDALTHYKTLLTYEWDKPVKPYRKSRYSLLELTPKTGRMHQLRKHLNKISHPIIGDHQYGDRNYNKLFTKEFGLDRLFLHAYKISFVHPLTKKEINIKAPLPTQWSSVFGAFKWSLT